MKIEGYKIESNRQKSGWYWTIKKDEQMVGQIFLRAFGNRHGFGSTLSSYVSVEVRGPVYFTTADACFDKGQKSEDIHLLAMMAAEKAGHYKMWTKGGTGGNVKDRLVQGRDMIKTCAWPLMLEMLKVGK